MLAGDFNTDLIKDGVNKRVFTELLLVHEGYALYNQDYTYRKGERFSKIDHVALFDKQRNLECIKHLVLTKELFSDHNALFTILKTH